MARARKSDPGFRAPSVSPVSSVADRLGTRGWNAEPVAVFVCEIRVALWDLTDQDYRVHPPSLYAELPRERIGQLVVEGMLAADRRAAAVRQSRDSLRPRRTSRTFLGMFVTIADRERPRHVLDPQ